MQEKLLKTTGHLKCLGYWRYCYGAYVLTVTIMPHDQNDETIISLVLGQLSGILGTMAAFWFSGSSTK